MFLNVRVMQIVNILRPAEYSYISNAKTITNTNTNTDIRKYRNKYRHKYISNTDEIKIYIDTYALAKGTSTNKKQIKKEMQIKIRVQILSLIHI